MSSNAAVSESWSEFLDELGGISADRVRQNPFPGKATSADLIHANRDSRLCELVDGTLVEKAMGWQESLIAIVLASLLRDFVQKNQLGFVTGADGLVELFPSLVALRTLLFFPGNDFPTAKSRPTQYPRSFLISRSRY